MQKFIVGVMALALLAMTGVSSAQQPGRIRGQIEKIDGNTMSLKARGGNMMNISVADDVRVSALVKASLADIKDDSFIGVAGVPQDDGSINAFSIHIFLPAQRGVVADRHGPWDERPNSTMTNGYVTSAVAAKDGETLTVKYKDGEKSVNVTAATVIAAVAPGNKSELKVGTPVIIMASEKQADGSVLAKVMYIGRDVKPAM